MQNQKQQNQGEIIFVSFTFQHNNKQIYIDVDENCTLDRAFEELCKKYKWMYNERITDIKWEGIRVNIDELSKVLPKAKTKTFTKNDLSRTLRELGIEDSDDIKLYQNDTKAPIWNSKANMNNQINNNPNNNNFNGNINPNNNINNMNNNNTNNNFNQILNTNMWQVPTVNNINTMQNLQNMPNMMNNLNNNNINFNDNFNQNPNMQNINNINNINNDINQNNMMGNNNQNQNTMPFPTVNNVNTMQNINNNQWNNNINAMQNINTVPNNVNNNVIDENKDQIMLYFSFPKYNKQIYIDVSQSITLERLLIELVNKYFWFQWLKSTTLTLHNKSFTKDDLKKTILELDFKDGDTLEAKSSECPDKDATFGDIKECDLKKINNDYNAFVKFVFGEDAIMIEDIEKQLKGNQKNNNINKINNVNMNFNGNNNNNNLNEPNHKGNIDITKNKVNPNPSEVESDVYTILNQSEDFAKFCTGLQDRGVDFNQIDFSKEPLTFWNCFKAFFLTLFDGTNVGCGFWNRMCLRVFFENAKSKGASYHFVASNKLNSQSQHFKISNQEQSRKNIRRLNELIKKAQERAKGAPKNEVSKNNLQDK